MNDDVETTTPSTVDVGVYCREVEAHLTRANAGHLVRIVGPAFELVRRWAGEGVPLSVVVQAIDLKADRHRAGQSKHPLRIEFCERDVRIIFDQWRRAVGLPASAVAEAADDESGGDGSEPAGTSAEERRRPSLSKHLERIIERTTRAAARLETPEPLRDALTGVLEQLVPLRAEARGLRGPARAAAEARLAPLDEGLVVAARAAAPPAVLDELQREAAAELAPYRGRLTGSAWEKGIRATVDRLLRERYGLPFLVLS